MKKRRSLVISLLLIAALAIGVGYAAINDIPLDITGTAEVAADQANFKVIFKDPVPDAAGNATISVVE